MSERVSVATLACPRRRCSFEAVRLSLMFCACSLKTPEHTEITIPLLSSLLVLRTSLSAV